MKSLNGEIVNNSHRVQRAVVWTLPEGSGRRVAFQGPGFRVRGLECKVQSLVRGSQWTMFGVAVDIGCTSTGTHGLSLQVLLNV